jgi:hypothetical protein
MAPGNRSYPVIATFEQIVLANENYNALLELHTKYWMNRTMLKSCLNRLLSKREVSAVEFIMTAIDSTTNSQIKRHDPTYLCYASLLKDWALTPTMIGVLAP